MVWGGLLGRKEASPRLFWFGREKCGGMVGKGESGVCLLVSENLDGCVFGRRKWQGVSLWGGEWRR